MANSMGQWLRSAKPPGTFPRPGSMHTSAMPPWASKQGAKHHLLPLSSGVLSTPGRKVLTTWLAWGQTDSRLAAAAAGICTLKHRIVS